MSVSFIHAADLHIDSPLRGLPGYDLAPIDQVRGASRRAFSKLVDQAIERNVDFLILAGDIWDGRVDEITTGLFFVDQCRRLERAAIPVFMVLGNHDAESKITKPITLPSNVYRFSHLKPESKIACDGRVVLHGQSFAHAAVTENLAIGYPDADPEKINIGLLHTALAGHADHETYAPCTTKDLKNKGYDYWALGHVHEYSVIAEGDRSQGGTVTFPGVLQGRHAREIGKKGALFVTISDEGDKPVLERLILNIVQWEAIHVDVSNCEHLVDVTREIEEKISSTINELLSDSEEALLAARIILEGVTPLHGRLRIELDRVLNDARGVNPDRAYIEKLRLETRSPDANFSREHSTGDALVELSVIAERISSEATYNAELVDMLEEFVKNLPEQCRDEFESLRPEVFNAVLDRDASELIDDARPNLIDWLRAE